VEVTWGQFIVLGLGIESRKNFSIWARTGKKEAYPTFILGTGTFTPFDLETALERLYESHGLSPRLSPL